MKTNTRYLKNEELMKKIARRYFYSIRKCEEMGLQEYDYPNIYREFVMRVRKAFNRLNNLQQYIINNEFFYENYPEWWRKIYPKEVFIRLKGYAMEVFLKEVKDENY